MGNNNSHARNLQYEPKEWEEVERGLYYEVMRNRRGEQAFLHHFNIKEGMESEREIEIYQNRKNPANWVQIIGANLNSSGFGFCGTQQNVLVLTEPIPFLLDAVDSFNRQQSLVVLYNALKGYYDIKNLEDVVPIGITSKMIGFNKSGKTKVWINQNFGMNHSGNYHSSAQFNETSVINQVVDLLTGKVDLSADLLNNVRRSKSLIDALNYIRMNGGVAANVLDNNQINLQTHRTGAKLNILSENTQIQNVAPPSVVAQTNTTYVQPQFVQPQYQPVQPQYQQVQAQYQPVQAQQVYYQPPVGPQGLQSGLRTQTATYVSSQGPTQSFYQVPAYSESVGPNKFSFQASQ